MLNEVKHPSAATNHPYRLELFGQQSTFPAIPELINSSAALWVRPLGPALTKENRLIFSLPQA
jgi:hypothetical protein